MRILFLDQSGQLGGAELCLLDIARYFGESIQVALFRDGPFRELLEQQHIPVQVLADRPLAVRKDSSWVQGMASLGQLLPLVGRVARLSRDYDLIYANTQKALVVGALASQLSRRPLVYHLHDILSPDHFSATNRRLAVTLANRAALVIATSQACRDACLAAGGRADRIQVVYNGFDPDQYQVQDPSPNLKSQLGWEDRFVVGHFSRLSPWKGQHILLEALTHCPASVCAVFVGDALFGEQDYAQQLQAQVEQWGLQKRVRFLGFRSAVVPLMAGCDLIAHTSTAPEPFGRVIVEAMLCQRPIVAAAAGGVVELVESGSTGWLVPPGDPRKLAEVIRTCYTQPERAKVLAQAGHDQACQRFHLRKIQGQIDRLLYQVIPPPGR